MLIVSSFAFDPLEKVIFRVAALLSLSRGAAPSHSELSQHQRQRPPSSAPASLSLTPQVSSLALKENRSKFQLH